MPWPRRNPFGAGYVLYAGGQWVNLSARAVDKVLDSPLNDSLMRYLRRAPNADEAWAGTVAINGAPDLVVINDRKRYIRWPGGTAHPAVLGPADVPALRASTDFFARKLDPAAWPEGSAGDNCGHERGQGSGCPAWAAAAEFQTAFTAPDRFPSGSLRRSPVPHR